MDAYKDEEEFSQTLSRKIVPSELFLEINAILNNLSADIIDMEILEEEKESIPIIIKNIEFYDENDLKTCIEKISEENYIDQLCDILIKFIDSEQINADFQQHFCFIFYLITFAFKHKCDYKTGIETIVDVICITYYDINYNECLPIAKYILKLFYYILKNEGEKEAFADHIIDHIIQFNYDDDQLKIQIMKFFHYLSEGAFKHLENNIRTYINDSIFKLSVLEYYDGLKFVYYICKIANKIDLCISRQVLYDYIDSILPNVFDYTENKRRYKIITKLIKISIVFDFFDDPDNKFLSCIVIESNDISVQEMQLFVKKTHENSTGKHIFLLNFVFFKLFRIVLFI